jgi:hypothetical protein
MGEKFGYYGGSFQRSCLDSQRKIIDCFGSIPCCSMPVLHRCYSSDAYEKDIVRLK